MSLPGIEQRQSDSSGGRAAAGAGDTRTSHNHLAGAGGDAMQACTLIRDHAPAGLGLRSVMVVLVHVATVLCGLHESGATHGYVRPWSTLLTASQQVRLLPRDTFLPGAGGGAAWSLPSKHEEEEALFTPPPPPAAVHEDVWSVGMLLLSLALGSAWAQRVRAAAGGSAGGDGAVTQGRVAAAAEQLMTESLGPAVTPIVRATFGSGTSMMDVDAAVRGVAVAVFTPAATLVIRGMLPTHLHLATLLMLLNLLLGLSEDEVVTTLAYVCPTQGKAVLPLCADAPSLTRIRAMLAAGHGLMYLPDGCMLRMSLEGPEAAAASPFARDPPQLPTPPTCMAPTPPAPLTPPAPPLFHIPAERVAFLRGADGALQVLLRSSTQVTYAAVMHGSAVAVKVVHGTGPAAMATELAPVAAMLHPNMVVVHGMAQVPSSSAAMEYGVVMERCPLSMGAVLRDLAAGGSFHGGASTSACARMGWAVQAGEALAFLHRRGMYHTNIKPDNMGWDPVSGIAKIADVTPVLLHSVAVMSRGMRGSPMYMCPALASGTACVTDKTDVYSWGVTLWELITLRSPYKDLAVSSVNDFFDHVRRGRRPATSAELAALSPPGVGDLIARCWDPNPESRPSMADAVAQLSALLAPAAAPTTTGVRVPSDSGSGSVRSSAPSSLPSGGAGAGSLPTPSSGGASGSCSGGSPPGTGVSSGGGKVACHAG